MTSIEKTYLQMICRSCHLSEQNGEGDKENPQKETLSEQTAHQLLELAKKQYMVPFLLQDLKGTSYLEYVKRQAKMMMFNYYQIEELTIKTTQLLEANHIPYILLKGISLSACYPVPEYRKLGDLDLLILDQEKLELTKKVLKDNQYEQEEEESDHHLTYLYKFANGRRHIVEVHYRIVGVYHYAPANHMIDQVFSKQRLKPAIQRIEGRDYPVLPPTEYMFYMLHHMLKHYLYDGFGIRLLCDFSLYAEKNRQEIDFKQLNEWCSKSGMTYFYATIMACCKKYLGFSGDIPGIQAIPENECDQFLTQILEGYDVGNEKQSSLVYSGTYRKVNLLSYFKEGHTQMKVRFPKLGKVVPIWPVLWGITFYHFVRNTYKVRNTTLRQTMKDFKADNQRAQNLHLFEKND